MADTTTTGAPPVEDDSILTRPSMWGKSLDFTTLDADPKRWDQEWEGLLATLSPQKAFVVMGRTIARKEEKIRLKELSDYLIKDICGLQGAFVELWRQPEVRDRFDTAWMLLGIPEKERRLLEGLKEASRTCIFRQDVRSLCPEIRTSSLLVRAGRAFTNLVDKYVAGKEAMVDSTLPHLFPSAWWDKACDGVPNSVLDILEESAFMVLSLLRNAFIVRFLTHCVMSLCDELFGKDSDSTMSPTRKLMEEEPLVAQAIAHLTSVKRDKPLIRCENCTKSQEDISHGVQFMLCSVCKRKLQFEIHYCSVDCQKKDWPQHKKNCGKQKVSKKLKGTVHDPYWQAPDIPDHQRVQSLTPDGFVRTSDTGFGTASAAASYSPALQRQVALLRADTDADYFLFDVYDRPVRFASSDVWTKMMFRWCRSDALGPREQFGVECMADHLLKIMGKHSSLSRDRILAQLKREYGGGVDLEGEIARKLANNVADGDHPESTFVENTARISRLSEEWRVRGGNGNLNKSRSN